MKARAEKVCRGLDITREKELLFDVFVASGYPEEMTWKSLESKKGRRVSQIERMRE